MYFDIKSCASMLKDIRHSIRNADVLVSLLENDPNLSERIKNSKQFKDIAFKGRHTISEADIDAAYHIFCEEYVIHLLFPMS